MASARRAFDDGRWRNLAPLDKERRLRRLSELTADHGAVFSDIDVLDAGLLKAYTGFIVQATVDAIDYYAGWPTKISGSIPAVPGDVAVYVHARADRRGRAHRAVERSHLRARIRGRRPRRAATPWC